MTATVTVSARVRHWWSEWVVGLLADLVRRWRRPKSLGPKVAKFATIAGIELDPNRKRLLGKMCSRDVDGTWWFRHYTVPNGRDGGKDLLELRALAGLFLFDEHTIVWAAENYRAANDTFHRVAALVEGTPQLREQVAKIRYANGEQRIELRNGNRLLFATPNGVRGLTASTVLVDGWLDMEAEWSVWPTLATAANPQWVQRAAAVRAGEA